MGAEPVPGELVPSLTCLSTASVGCPRCPPAPPPGSCGLTPAGQALCGRALVPSPGVTQGTQGRATLGEPIPSPGRRRCGCSVLRQSVHPPLPTRGCRVDGCQCDRDPSGHGAGEAPAAIGPRSPGLQTRKSTVDINNHLECDLKGRATQADGGRCGRWSRRLGPRASPLRSWPAPHVRQPFGRRGKSTKPWLYFSFHGHHEMKRS